MVPSRSTATQAPSYVITAEAIEKHHPRAVCLSQPLPQHKVPDSCELDHAGPPLGKRSDIDVIFAHKVELAVFAHAKHGKAGRYVQHLVALPLRGGSKRSGYQEARAGVEPERARMRSANVGVLNGSRLAGLLIDG